MVLMVFTPTKWTIQFGIYSGLAAAVAATATLAVAQSAARSTRNLTVFVSGLMFALAAATAGKNAWPYFYDVGIAWFDRAPVLMGIPMSTIFLIYTGASIAQTFFATSAAFAGLSLWGYTTKKDLSGFGTFLIMGVVGLLVASLINIFMQSGTMNLVISFVGVLLFAGLTAYDTQRIKSMYAYVAGTDMVGKTVIMGALSLYLDFINMFQFLLSFLGDRR